jgi:hypothetical protein
MKAKTDQLTPAEHEWIVQQLRDVRTFVAKTLGKEPAELPSPEDLDQAFDAWRHSPSHDPAQANAIINCLGIAFGQHLVNSSPLRWVIASDDYGTELALHALPGKGDVVVYPQNLVAKRYESGGGKFIVETLIKIRQDVSDIQNLKEQKKWWKPW